MKRIICILILLNLATGCSGQSQPVDRADRFEPDANVRSNLPQDGGDSSIEATVCRALATPRPDGPEEAAKAYRQLFSNCPKERLLELANHANQSIALQARWELRHTRPPKLFDPNHPWDLPGFLEGEMGIRIPLTWSARFSREWMSKSEEAQRNLVRYVQAGYQGVRKDNFRFETGDQVLHVILGPELHQTASGWHAPPDTEISEDGDTLCIRVRQSRLQVAKAVIEGSPSPSRSDQRHLAALIGPVRSYLAVYDLSMRSYPLIGLDSTSGRVLWRVDVWACFPGSSPQMSGPGWHYVFLSGHDRQVTVFGDASHGGWYIESFDGHSGMNTLRFSTDYWGGDVFYFDGEKT